MHTRRVFAIQTFKAPHNFALGQNCVVLCIKSIKRKTKKLPIRLPDYRRSNDQRCTKLFQRFPRRFKGKLHARVFIAQTAKSVFILLRLDNIVRNTRSLVCRARRRFQIYFGMAGHRVNVLRYFDSLPILADNHKSLKKAFSGF